MIGARASSAYGSEGSSRCSDCDFFNAVACAMSYLLEQVLPLPCHPFFDLADRAAVAPGLGIDGSRSLEVEPEALFHLAREAAVEDDQVGLVVMDKASP